MYQEEPGKPSFSSSKLVNPSSVHRDSVSSSSVTASLSAPTMASLDPSSSGSSGAKPFVQRNGRTYLNDPTNPYPLPLDLTELHRQSLRTLMLIQVFGSPICSPSVLEKPPQRVLEVGCGTGFWSMMCHRFLKSKGHSNVSFTGIDIAPLAPGSGDLARETCKPDPSMRWKFVQHDIRHRPWPLPSGVFDLVMVKDMALAMPLAHYQLYLDEYLRVLSPGGTLELWDSDHTIRMLRPHVPGSMDHGGEQEAAAKVGAYVMTASTPLSAPLNSFLVECNAWILRAFETSGIAAVPCPHIGPYLVQEVDSLHKVGSRRLAIPLSEVRWEREGVGGVVTKDGKSYVEMKGKVPVEKKSLTPTQAALRRTALLTVVQEIQSLEAQLREVSGKSQDEWDLWMGKMMADLLGEGGTSWGECLEVGAWWAKKKLEE